MWYTLEPTRLRQIVDALMAFRLAKPIFASASSSAVWGLQRRAVSHLLASRKGQQLPPQSPRRARLAQPGAVSPSRVLALAESYRDRVTHLKRLRVKVGGCVCVGMEAWRAWFMGSLQTV